MMLRLFDPKDGSIKVDGQDLKKVKIDSLRKHVSIVPQNGVLFNDTILFNL